MRYKFFLLSLIFLQAGIAANACNNEEDSVKLTKRPFGPIIKFEPTGLIHHYSKILLGIEYFISPDVTLQHHVGPVITVENYNFDTQDYNRFRGFGFINEVRYYFYNQAHYGQKLHQKVDYGKIKTAFVGLEVNYSYTYINSNTILYNECDMGDCDYYQKIIEKGERNWLGVAMVVGTQMIINRKISIEIGGGLGIRTLWIDRTPDTEDARRAYRGMDFATEERTLPYPSLGFNIGYCLY